MKQAKLEFARIYQEALVSHLAKGLHADSQSALGLGARALVSGLQTLDLAKLHEATLVKQLLPACAPRRRAALIRRAGIFFAAAITPVENAAGGARQAAAQLKKFVESLSRRTVELAAANLELSDEIAQRKAAVQALRMSERHYASLLRKSARLQAQSKGLARQILSAHEDERKRISRELHDVIGQALTGINIRLEGLRRKTSQKTASLGRGIEQTCKLVEQSVKVIHQFARELRPAALDELGLIPALRAHLKAFTERTGVRARLTAFSGLERLDISRRTVLYRVAQEALSNVARHAGATRVDLSIERLPAGLRMKIQDDGASFDVERALDGRGSKRLGLLGMRERVEMVGGDFSIESAKGKGTTVLARLRLRPSARKRLGFVDRPPGRK